MRVIQILGSTITVGAGLYIIFYEVPYYIINDPIIPQGIKVGVLVALAGILIVLAAVAVEQRRTL